MLENVLGIHADADLPAYQSDTLEKRAARRPKVDLTPEPTDTTTGKVALFGTCYGNYNEPGPGEDLMTVFEHNGIPVILARDVQCCGMPKLELGDLEAIQGAGCEYSPYWPNSWMKDGTSRRWCLPAF